MKNFHPCSVHLVTFLFSCALCLPKTDFLTYYEILMCSLHHCLCCLIGQAGAWLDPFSLLSFHSISSYWWLPGNLNTSASFPGILHVPPPGDTDKKPHYFHPDCYIPSSSVPPHFMMLKADRSPKHWRQASHLHMARSACPEAQRQLMRTTELT